MDNETKDLLVEVIDLLKARNEADEKEVKEKAEDLKGEKEEKEPTEEKETVAENEDENEDDKKEEKEATNKCKAKNEDDVVDKRDIIRKIMAIAGKEENSEEVKTIAKLAEKLGYDKDEAQNEDDKKEDKEDDKKAENKKAKNSFDSNISKFYTEIKKSDNGYISQAKARELGKELY